MSDLISREALIEVIKNVQEHMREANAKPIPVDAREIFTLFAGMVNAQTPVEAVPVVHGEWLDTQPDYNNGFRRNARVCSNCHDYHTTEYDDLYFCPRCGANMKSEK